MKYNIAERYESERPVINNVTELARLLIRYINDIVGEELPLPKMIKACRKALEVICSIFEHEAEWLVEGQTFMISEGSIMLVRASKYEKDARLIEKRMNEHDFSERYRVRFISEDRWYKSSYSARS